MANARLSLDDDSSLNKVIEGYRRVYRTPLLEVFNRFLECGEEEYYGIIHFRCHLMKPLSSEIESIMPLIHSLMEKEILNERELLLLGWVYHFGIGIPKNKDYARVCYEKVIELEQPQCKVSKGLAYVSLSFNGDSEADEMLEFDFEDALKLLKEGEKWESGFAIFSQGNIYHNQGDEKNAKECYIRASQMNIVFALGLLGSEQKSEESISSYTFQATMLGCPESLYLLAMRKELNEYHQFLFQYHYYLTQGNTPLWREEKESKEKFTQLRLKHKEWFDEESDLDSWERIAPLLSKEASEEIIHQKQDRIGMISVICLQHLLPELVDMVKHYLFLPEYIRCQSTFFPKACKLLTEKQSLENQSLTLS